MHDFVQQSDLGFFSRPVLSVPLQRARSIFASHRWNYQRNTVVAKVAAESRVRFFHHHLCRGGRGGRGGGPAFIVAVGVAVGVDVGR